MGRVLITIIIPLLLPTALYLAWRLGVGRTANLSSVAVWLVIAGAGLAVLTLLLINTDFGGPQEGIYVPPHVSDGAVVPGQFKSGPPAPAPAR